jgi:hypothetical protein
VRVEQTGAKVIDLVNKAWPANKELWDVGLDYVKMQFSPEWKAAFLAYEATKSDIDAFKAELPK